MVIGYRLLFIEIFTKKFCGMKFFVSLHAEKRYCGFSSAGRAEASQASGRGFEPRNPLFLTTEA